VQKKVESKNTIPIQALWIGESLSIMEQLSISSFLKNGHEYHLYVYDEVKNIPRGTSLKDGNEIISSDRIFKYREHDSYSGFSNIFRYKLLLERGGYWADIDLVCLRKFDFVSDYVFAEEEITEKTKRICGNIIKAPKGSEMMQFCLDSSLKKEPDRLAWGEIGPDLITAAVADFQLRSHVRSYLTFNPINWWHWQDFLHDDLRTLARIQWKLLRKPHALHLWNEMWRRNGADKNKPYPRNSLYERLKRKYL
jgi:hypothetical protein